MRVVVGSLLLVLGLGWLRKAILRSSGHKDLHDEDQIYAETVAELSETGETGATGDRRDRRRRRTSAVPAPARSGRDGVAFAVAFKGVFLEGTEVVLIVISLGRGAAPPRPGRAGRVRRSSSWGESAWWCPASSARSPRTRSRPASASCSPASASSGSARAPASTGPAATWPSPCWSCFFVVVTLAYTAYMRTRLPAPGARGEPGVVMGAVVRGLRPSATSGGTSSIGDTPELALATGVIVAVAFLLDGERIAGGDPAAAAGGRVPPGQHAARPAAGPEPLARPRRSTAAFHTLRYGPERGPSESGGTMTATAD